jgi:hypothetical protein
MLGAGSESIPYFLKKSRGGHANLKIRARFSGGKEYMVDRISFLFLRSLDRSTTSLDIRSSMRSISPSRSFPPLVPGDGVIRFWLKAVGTWGKICCHDGMIHCFW